MLVAAPSSSKVWPTPQLHVVGVQDGDGRVAPGGRFSGVRLQQGVSRRVAGSFFEQVLAGHVVPVGRPLGVVGLASRAVDGGVLLARIVDFGEHEVVPVGLLCGGDHREGVARDDGKRVAAQVDGGVACVGPGKRRAPLQRAALAGSASRRRSGRWDCDRRRCPLGSRP